MERINVKVDEIDLLKTRKERKNSNIFQEYENEKLNQEEEEEEQQQEEKLPEAEQEENNQQDFQTPSRTPNRRVQKNHPLEQIIGDRSAGVETRRRRQAQTPEQGHFSLLSTVEPSNFEEARNGEHWIKAMEEELNQIEKNETWELVSIQKDKNVIVTKWVFRNNINKDGQVTRMIRIIFDIK